MTDYPDSPMDRQFKSFSPMVLAVTATMAGVECCWLAYNLFRLRREGGKFVIAAGEVKIWPGVGQALAPTARLRREHRIKCASKSLKAKLDLMGLQLVRR